MSLIALSGDWHFGLSNGDERHNQDLLTFVQFMIRECRTRGCTQFKHLGDWFDNRAKIDIISLNYACKAVEELTAYFGRYTQLVGNHDMAYKDRHDFTSLEMFRGQVDLVDTYRVDGDMIDVAWLCNQAEYDELIELTKTHGTRFVFGHFEFGGFQLNDHHTSHGASHNELRHVERIFTGHYHAPQRKDNVQYLGGPMPFDMNDANAEGQRGFWILDTESGELERVVFDNVKVLSLSFDEFQARKLADDPHTKLRVVVDRELTPDESALLQDRLEDTTFRQANIVHKVNVEKALVEQTTDLDGIETALTGRDQEQIAIMDVDQAVVHALDGMSATTETIRKERLVALYDEVKVA